MSCTLTWRLKDIVVGRDTRTPTSITDAYALMKVLCTKYDEKHFKVIMNNVDPCDRKPKKPSDGCIW